MNAFLAVTRLLLAQREKVVLAVMFLFCASATGLFALQYRKASAGSGDGNNGATLEDLVGAWGTPREARTYEPAQLQNSKPLDQFSATLERRPSPFRPGEGGGPTGPGNLAPVEQPWPNITVRQVSQPTPGGAWIAQLQVDGKPQIAREGRTFANKQFELQRIDKTRLCVEILRRLDDEVQEFCKE